MPYSNSWSDIIPAGSADPSTIDDQIRQLRLDIHERMDDIVDDWTDDPVVLSVSGIGVQTGVVVMFGPDILTRGRDEDDASLGDDYFESDNNANRDLLGHIALPINSVLTTFEAIVDINTAPSVDMALKYRLHSTSPGVTTVASVSRSSAGVGTMTTGIISHTIGTNRNYFVSFNNPSGGRFRVYSMKAVIDVGGLDAYIS